MTLGHYVGKSEAQLRAGWQTVADFVDAAATAPVRKPIPVDRVRKRWRSTVRQPPNVETAVVAAIDPRVMRASVPALVFGETGWRRHDRRSPPLLGRRRGGV